MSANRRPLTWLSLVVCLVLASQAWAEPRNPSGDEFRRSMHPEERRQMREQMREHWRHASPEDYREWRRHRPPENGSMSPEMQQRREARREALRQLPPEERQRLREEMRQRRAAGDPGRPDRPHGQFR